MAGALLGWRVASVRLASPVQAEDQPAASAELDRTVHQVFALANQHQRWEFNDLARRLDNQRSAKELELRRFPIAPLQVGQEYRPFLL